VPFKLDVEENIVATRGSSQQKKPEAANEDPRRAELSPCWTWIAAVPDCW